MSNTQEIEKALDKVRIQENTRCLIEFLRDERTFNTETCKSVIVDLLVDDEFREYAKEQFEKRND